MSRMALHAAALVAGEPWALRVADVCARADVELLRYPLPAEGQKPGQTMAIGAISNCLKRYGDETVITALQCVTQTKNNKPGALTADVVKALCEVLHSDMRRRDSGLALLEAFDAIDLGAIQTASAVEAAARRIGRAQAMAERIRSELGKLLPYALDQADRGFRLIASRETPSRSQGQRPNQS